MTWNDGMGPLTCDTPGSWGSSAEEDEYCTAFLAVPPRYLEWTVTLSVPPRYLECTVTLSVSSSLTRALYFILELNLSLVRDSSSSHYDEI